MSIVWDRKKLIEELNRLKLLFFVNEAQTKKEKILTSNDLRQLKNSIELYSLLLNRLAKEKEEEITNPLQTIVERRKEHIYCMDKLPKTIANYIYGLCTFLDVSEIPFSDFKMKRMPITSEDIVNKTYQFYNYFDNSKEEVLDYLYDESLVNIVLKSKLKNKNYPINCMLEDEYNNIPFVSIANNKNASSYEISIHETAHVIDMLLSDYKFNEDSRYYLDEIHSIFLSFVANDYFYNKYKTEKKDYEDEFVKNSYNYFQSLKRSLKSLGVNFELCRSKKLNAKKINDLYLNRYGLEERNLLEQIANYNGAEHSIKYLFSGVVALHLYEIYKDDPEKAVYLYQKSLNHFC